MNDLTESVHRVASETGFSGMVRIDHGDDTQLSEAYGLAHRGFRLPNTVDTQFAIASGGKGFTALAVVSLIADGVISLDTTARSVLGIDLPHIADDVTVGHLLAHRSGIGDYLDEENEDLDSNDYVHVSPMHQLATTEAFLTEVDGYSTKFAAGQRFSYCNGGYIVLALIAERASGASYHDLVSEEILIPAGLADTAFLRSDEPSGPHGPRLPAPRRPSNQRSASPGPWQRRRRDLHDSRRHARFLERLRRRSDSAGGVGGGDDPAAQ